jgi:hypothetical protein
MQGRNEIYEESTVSSAIEAKEGSNVSSAIKEKNASYVKTRRWNNASVNRR